MTRRVPEQAIQRVENHVRNMVSHKGVRHIVAGIESVDGSFRWRFAAGDANRQRAPMDADTPFLIASVTKLYTATAVLKLREQGRLAIDEPIATYLAHMPLDGLHRLGGVDYSGEITVRHLLGHTSGLPDYFEGRPKGGRSVSERLQSDGDLAWTPEEVCRIVRTLPPSFPPQPAGAARQRARYSDTNYQLLGAIIEAVAGRPLHEVFEALLFEPLGLRDTYLSGSPPRPSMPEPATLWFGDQPLHAPLAFSSLGPDGGLVSTLADTLAFLRALVTGRIFDDPGTFHVMQDPWNRFGFSLHPAALRTPQWPIEYGLGIMRFRLPRIFTPRRAVPAVIGHTGASGSWLFSCPQMELLFSGTVDQATGAAVPYRLIPRLLRILERPAA